MKLKIRTAILLASCVVVAAKSQQPTITATEWNADAIKAYRARDYKAFLADEKRALDLEPGNPRFLYNVACGEALQGNAQEAVRLLDQLLARRLDLGAQTDEDFSKIHGTPEWIGFEARLAILRRPQVSSEVAFRLSDPTLLATGIAVNPRTGDTYIASVRERKIIRRTKNGSVSDFIKEGQDGFLSGVSLAIDSSRQILYATTAAVPYMVGYRKDDFGRSGVFAFDLKSGKLVRKILLPADGKRHFLNALVVDRQGDVYISDTGLSGIYRLPTTLDDLEVFVPSNVFAASQGLAFSDDEKTLYVADYTDGLWALEMVSKTRRRLKAPPDVWLGGLDGLSRARDAFIAVQIGVKPERVLRIRLDSQGDRITGVEPLEMNHPDYEGPIQGVVAGSAFFYVANCQLDLGNGETGEFAADRARPTVVLRLPL
jgi:sugar lactone lactonase YvrE